MKLVFTVFAYAAIILFCQSANSYADLLTAEDIAFLKGCNIEQVDIDVIPNLPEDGRVNLELVLEYPRKHCNMQTIIDFKTTREYLKKFTPPPLADSAELTPPARYNRIYLTISEQVYISKIFEKLRSTPR